MLPEMCDVIPVKDVPKLAEFYKGRSIFITGFSGFMGKALVEKILWSCPDVRKVFFLLRGKRGATAEERLNKILKSECFSRGREHRSDTFNKLVSVYGDVTLPGLGLSEKDRLEIMSEVSIIIHGAASVKFDDPFTYAIDINVKGTKSVLDLALNMPQLEVFAHISTAYSNCDRFDIDEKMYAPHGDWEETIKLREKIDEETLNILYPKYSNHMPNTYVFTKSLGEHMVYDHGKKLPVLIYRPSIVTGSYEEPVRGWVDNFNGPNGLLFGYCTGVIRTSNQILEHKLDFIPCDIAIRMLLCAVLLRPSQTKEIVPVYNAATKDEGPTMDEFTSIGAAVVREYPMKYLLWTPTSATTPSFLVFYINFTLFQLLPAIFIDLFLKLIGKKTVLVKLQRKVFIACSALLYFTLNCFRFENKNALAVEKFIHPEDWDELHYARKREVDFDLYEYCVVVHKFMCTKFLKQKPEDLERARKVLKVFIFVDAVLKYGFLLFVAWLIYKYQVVQTLMVGAYNFLNNF